MLVSLKKTAPISIGGLFLFFSVFDPQIPFFPNGIGFSFLIALLLILPFSYLESLRGFCFFKKEMFPFVVLFLIALSLILVRIILNDGGNLSFVLSWFKAFFVFLSVYFVYRVFFYGLGFSVFVKVVIALYVINAAINLLAGSFPEQFVFLEYFRGENLSEKLGKNPYRNSFISGSGFYSIGVAYGLVCFLLGHYLFLVGSRGFFIYFSFVLILLSGFVAARTSFFASGGALLYSARGGLLKFFKMAIILITLVSVLLMLPDLQPYRLWMLSFFLEFNESSSGSHLINEMYFWPGEKIFLWGDGYVNSGKFTYTDGGYMQDILFGGFLFLLVKLSFLFLFILRFFRRFPFFVMFISVALLAFHFKGLFFYNNAQGMSVFYLLNIYLSMVLRGRVF